ncbi:hypothetical protein VTO73DRAFT_7160 [Trametes versicolor]
MPLDKLGGWRGLRAAGNQPNKAARWQREASVSNRGSTPGARHPTSGSLQHRPPHRRLRHPTPGPSSPTILPHANTAPPFPTRRATLYALGVGDGPFDARPPISLIPPSALVLLAHAVVAGRPVPDVALAVGEVESPLVLLALAVLALALNQTRLRSPTPHHAQCSTRSASATLASTRGRRPLAVLLSASLALALTQTRLRPPTPHDAPRSPPTRWPSASVPSSPAADFPHPRPLLSPPSSCLCSAVLDFAPPRLFAARRLLSTFNI